MASPSTLKLLFFWYSFYRFRKKHVFLIFLINMFNFFVFVHGSLSTTSNVETDRNSEAFASKFLENFNIQVYTRYTGDSLWCISYFMEIVITITPVHGVIMLITSYLTVEDLHYNMINHREYSTKLNCVIRSKMVMVNMIVLPIISLNYQ